MGDHRKSMTDENRRELDDLLARFASVNEKGFAIELETEAPRWDAALKRAGLHRGYRHMAQWLDQAYRTRFGRPYVFTENCVAYEIEYHADAYFWAAGYRGYRRNVTSLLFSKEDLISHCRVIDISTDDVAVRRQRLMFRYRRGVRREYRNTPLDPFDRSALPARILKRLRRKSGKDEVDG